MISIRFVEKVIEQANQLKPDAFVLTGDYVSSAPKYIRPVINAFGKLKSPFGTYAVLGNHDHWEGEELCVKNFRRNKIALLTNTNAVITKKRFYLYCRCR